jgi:hypothetical protein
MREYVVIIMLALMPGCQSKGPDKMESANVFSRFVDGLFTYSFDRVLKGSEDDYYQDGVPAAGTHPTAWDTPYKGYDRPDKMDK